VRVEAVVAERPALLEAVARVETARRGEEVLRTGLEAQAGIPARALRSLDSASGQWLSVTHDGD